MPENEEQVDDETKAKQFAHVAMVASADGVTRSLDTFASWLLAGGGAFIAIVLSQAKELEHLVSISAIARAATLYLWAVGLGIVGRYLAAGIAGSTSQRKAADKMFKNFKAQDPQVFWVSFFDEVQKLHPWPWRYFIKRMLDKMLAGDASYPARLITRISSAHTVIVVLEGVLILWSLGILIGGIQH